MADIRRDPGQVSPMMGGLPPIQRDASAFNAVSGLAQLGVKAYEVYDKNKQAERKGTALNEFRQGLFQDAPIFDTDTDNVLLGLKNEAKKFYEAERQGANPASIRNKRIKRYREFVTQYPEYAEDAAKEFKLQVGEDVGKELDETIEAQATKLAEQQAEAVRNYTTQQYARWGLQDDQAGRDKLDEIEARKGAGLQILNQVSAYESMGVSIPKEKLQEYAVGAADMVYLSAQEASRDIIRGIGVGKDNPSQNSSPEAVQSAINELKSLRSTLYLSLSRETKGKFTREEIEKNIFGSAFETIDNKIDELQNGDKNAADRVKNRFDIFEVKDKILDLKAKMGELNTPEKRAAHWRIENVLSKIEGEQVLAMIMNDPGFGDVYRDTFSVVLGTQTGRPVPNPILGADRSPKHTTNITKFAEALLTSAKTPESKELATDLIDNISSFSSKDLQKLSTSETFDLLKIAANPSFKDLDSQDIPQQYQQILFRGTQDFSRAILSPLRQLAKEAKDPAQLNQTLKGRVTVEVSDSGNIVFKLNNSGMEKTDRLFAQETVMNLNKNFGTKFGDLAKVHAHVGKRNENYKDSATMLLKELGTLSGIDFFSLTDVAKEEEAKEKAKSDSAS